MARKKEKYGMATTFNLDVEIVKLLDEYSKETGIPKTVICEKALKQYIEQQNKAE